MSTIKQPNGTHISGAPLTTSITAAAAPGLLQNAIDERIVKIRPMASPIDQISRCAGARSCGSMKVSYYSVDTKAISAKVKTDVAAGAATLSNDQVKLIIKTTNDEIFEPSDTVLLPMIEGGDGNPLILYVESRGSSGLTTIVVNPVEDDDEPTSPAIAHDTEMVRMGRAAAELDVQTAQFEALPVKRTNNCQIFKMQVEQSTFQKLANKEVGWDFSDQEEVAVMDMRLGMEKSFLFGKLATIRDTVKREDIMLTGGIWGQTDKTFRYDPASFGSDTLVDLCSFVFTGNSGSTRKILLAGTGFVDMLSKMEYSKVVQAGDTFVKWGLEFREIRSNYGSLYVIHSEIFDQCGHASDAFVLDPDYLTKYCHVPFHTETLDLRRSGVRNTDAVVITEASCLVLRHPGAHARIVANAN